MDIEQLMEEAHQTACEKGWWDNERTFGDQVALMHSELSEALEEFRNFGVEGNRLLYVIKAIDESMAVPMEIEDGDTEKPEGIAAEFADVLIRIFDTCQRYNIPLARAIQAKMEYNKSRPHRHGGKAI